MRLPVPVRRTVYRVGYQVLQVIWFIAGSSHRGVKCTVCDGEQVLLVRHTYGRRWWDLPGGTIERGEPPSEAARREMSEELGLTGVDWDPVGEIEFRSRRRTDRLYCFRAELSRPALELDPGELAEARWFRQDALPDRRSPHLDAILGLNRRRG